MSRRSLTFFHLTVKKSPGAHNVIAPINNSLPSLLLVLLHFFHLTVKKSPGAHNVIAPINNSLPSLLLSSHTLHTIKKEFIHKRSSFTNPIMHVPACVIANYDVIYFLQLPVRQTEFLLLFSPHQTCMKTVCSKSDID